MWGEEEGSREEQPRGIWRTGSGREREGKALKENEIGEVQRKALKETGTITVKVRRKGALLNLNTQERIPMYT